jgi:hypothetical protein
MGIFWYDKGPVTNPLISKSGAVGPPAGTYYYVIIPVITTQAGFGSGVSYYLYQPQYYGQRSAELSIAVNGSEGVKLDWDALAGVDYFIIFRSKTQNDFNSAVRDRNWYVAGGVTTFTDTGQATDTSVSYVNIPPRRHGAYVIDSDTHFFWVIQDAVANGRDCMWIPWQKATAEKEYGLNTSYIFPAVWFFCQIHIKSGILYVAYAGYYESVVIQSGHVFTCSGAGLWMSHSVTGNGIAWGVDQGLIWSKFIMAATATYKMTNVYMFQIGQAGWIYTDEAFSCALEWWNVTIPNIRGFDVNPAATGSVQRLTRSSSYYGTRQYSAVLTTFDDVVCRDSGEVIFLSGATASTWRNFKYLAPFWTDKDIRFYNGYTGITIFVNPTFKTGTPVPNVWTSPAGARTGYVLVKFTFNLKVVDVDGVAISGASVKIYDANGNLLHDLTTGVDGKIAATDVQHAKYEPAFALDGPAVVTNYHPHRLYVTKAGYRELDYDLVIDHPTDMTVPLMLTGGGAVGPVVEGVDAPTVIAATVPAVVEAAE